MLVGQPIFPEYDSHDLVVIHLDGTRPNSHFASLNQLENREAVFNLVHVLRHLDDLAVATLYLRYCTPFNPLIATTLHRIYGYRVRLHAKRMHGFRHRDITVERFRAIQPMVQWEWVVFDSSQSLQLVLPVSAGALTGRCGSSWRVIWKELDPRSRHPSSDIDEAVNVGAALGTFCGVIWIHLNAGFSTSRGQPRAWLAQSRCLRSARM